MVRRAEASVLELMIEDNSAEKPYIDPKIQNILDQETRRHLLGENYFYAGAHAMVQVLRENWAVLVN